VSRAHIYLVLVNDHDGLAAGHTQAAPGAVKGDRRLVFRSVQNQAFIG
jgi:hypothetical protein